MGHHLNILHLSDLHLGWNSADYHFKNMRDDLYRDIHDTLNEKVFAQAGGIHLVIFTGDLTFRGEAEQFEELSKVLDDMWNFFQDKLNCRPLLACVPGNHDLQRPKMDKRPEEFWAARQIVDSYFEKPDYYEFFWQNFPESSHSKLIYKLFAPFTDWYENRISVPVVQSQPGLFPGDFSARYEHNGISIGLVGLNTAFFHLDDSAYRHLEIHPRQLFEVCDSDPGQWLSGNDFNCLMTHHGPDWYHEQAKTRYHSEIYKPGRFDAHVFGHVHQAKTEITQISGSAERRYMIAKSLYGMEHYQGSDSKKPRQRSHGYSILQFVRDEANLTMKCFPRASVIKAGEVNAFDRDPDFSLDRQEGWVPPQIHKRLVQALYESKTGPGPALDSVTDKNRGNLFEMRRIALKDESYLEILQNIETHVGLLWDKHANSGWAPMHDTNHNRQVEKALYKLIPEEKYNKFQSYEWFILLASVWLHEIGMITDLFEKKDEIARKKEGEYFMLNIRASHDQRAIDYIEANHKDLEITKFKDIIQFLCRHHRQNRPIPEDLKKNREFGIDVDIELLVAYLRLALATHLDVDIDDQMLFELMHTPGLSWEDRFHWQKQRWIDDIIINYENYLITVMAYTPPADSFLNEIFPEKLIADMREGLIMVRDTLARGQISFFYEVEHKSSGKIDPAYISQMQLICSNIDLEEISSASQAYNTVLDTFYRFTTSESEQAMDLVESYYNNIRTVFQSRPCHTLIRNLNKKLEKILGKKESSDQEKLQRIRELISKRKSDREDLILRIRDNARPFLMDGGSILIYGYSTMVIHALESIPENIRKETDIYISECRGKVQFNQINTMVYNDGIQYAKHCSPMGFRALYFIPDSSVANLMKRNKISKVLFGANGIDKSTWNFGHTCGHLMVADLTSIYDVPLYVISDSSKIGELGDYDKINRNIDWLPKIKGIEWEHKNEEEGVNYKSLALINPREDTVTSERITMIITENGARRPRNSKMVGLRKTYSLPEGSDSEHFR